MLEAYKSDRRMDYTMGPRRALKKFNSRTRIYFWLKEYNPIEEITTGVRWSKPYKEFKRHMREVFEKLELTYPGDNVFHWSQKAGCSCGCSPGFIMDRNLGFDIHVGYSY